MRISDWSSDVCSSDLPVHELRRAGEPVAVFQHCLQLQDAQRQQGQRGHQRQADVEQPERTLQPAFAPVRLRLDAAQAEQHQAQAEHAVHTEQCRVTMRGRSEEHTSELQSLMRISYAVFCLKKKTNN